jgi:hypothetical protein
LPLKVEPLDPEIIIEKDGIGNARLRISDTAQSPAFFIRVRTVEESGTLKTFYDDNYISLMPGETKIISVQFRGKDLKNMPQNMHFEVSGINCSTRELNMKVVKKQPRL